MKMYQQIVTKQEVWVLQNVLNQGGFGIVYETTKSSDDTPKFITKCQSRVCKHDHMLNEKRVYECLKCDLNYSQFIPEIHECGPNFIIMKKFDIDVDQYFNTHVVPKKIIHFLISQVLNALEFIHMHNYSHGDIKTSNMLLDLENKENPTLKISDFGLGSLFVSHKTRQHLEYSKTISPHRGTLAFISEDAHKGVVPSRRSDLENFGWVMIQSFFRGLLSWRNLTGKTHVMNEKIKRKTFILKSGTVKTILPDHSTTRLDLYFKHIFSLEYSACPKYKMLIGLFTT